jgi:hypothetical protein
MNIKKIAAIILFVFIAGSLAALPLISSAAANGSGNVAYTTPALWPTGFWGPIVWCTGSFTPTANPTPSPTPGTAGNTPPTCNNLCDLIGTFINVIYLLLSIAIFILTPVFLVWGGVMIMLAGANPGMLETGKKILTGTAISLVIVLCSYLLVNTVLSVLNVTSIGGFNGNTSTCSLSGSDSGSNLTPAQTPAAPTNPAAPYGPNSD